VGQLLLLKLDVTKKDWAEGTAVHRLAGFVADRLQECVPSKFNNAFFQFQRKTLILSSL
jgi:hypothetical protein